MENIELFDEYTATILAALYESFPVPRAIDARKLCGHEHVNDFGRIIDDLGRPSRKFDIALSTISWLETAGFIISRDRNQYGHANVSPTLAGLQLLTAVPESVASKETRGEKLVRLVREGSLGLVREAAKAAIAAGVAAGPS